MNALEGIEAKVRRADAHLVELFDQLRAYGASEPFETSFAQDPDDPRWWAGTVELRTPVPPLIGVIVGDIVHNLRSALDHLVNAIVVGSGSRPTRQTCFPIFRSKSKYVAKVERARLDGTPSPLLGVDDQTAARIERMQPFHTSDAERAALWLLHEMWNADKHRAVQTGLAMIPNVEPTISVRSTGAGNGLSVESITSTGPVSHGAEVIRFRVIGDAVYDSLHVKAEMPLEVAVGEHNVQCGQLLVAREDVARVLKSFERNFRVRRG